MENATKALLIAGGVLITILILSIGVYLHSMFSNQSKEYTETISAIELEKFNSKFDVYVGRTDVTAQEVVSVVNLAREYDYQIQIYLGLSLSPLEFDSTYTQEDFIKEKQDKTFSCTLNTSDSNMNPEYDGNGKITKLRFKEN